ncbi:phage baseplate assembly protein V [Alteromonas sp. a30]|uniref:phage baseplate assembly protein V n=1 Tax=Alteromonas sp. a30 TaxID=2730917 RepID=UPI0022802925|nr:phage baseplate assembly protein V [Alteromonas sp. a30]MCY7296520.1 hypothetical protein [Alteromonas sp. a30]
MVKYTFTVGGKEIEGMLVSLLWRYGINRIPECTLRVAFIDAKEENENLAAFNLKKAKSLSPGQAFELKGVVEVEGAKKGEAEFKGIITKRKIGIDTHPYADITATGEVVKLTEGRFTQFFKADKHADDTKVIEAIAKASKVKLAVPKKGIAQEQLFIYDQTPWRAIMSRALVNGFLYVPSHKGDKIVDAEETKKAAKAAVDTDFFKDGIEQIWIEQDIRSQLDSVQFDAWDVKAQKVLKGTPDESTGLEGFVPVPFKSLGIKQAQNVTLSLPAAEINAKAKAEQFYRQLDHIQGALVFNVAANPAAAKLMPLDAINLKGVGDTFSGKHLVTGVSHHVSSNGWQVRVELGLHLNHTLFSDWNTPTRIPNLTGIVGKFAKDAAGFYRIPVWIPGVSKDDKDVLFARLASPFASAEKSGLYLPPNEKDEVVLSFLGGDARFPVIVGAMHNPVNKAPLEYAEKNQQVGFFWGKQKLGLHALLKDGEAGLSLAGGEKSAMTLNDKTGWQANLDKNAVVIGKTVELKHNNKGAVIVDADKVDIKTGTCTVEVSAKMEVK